MQRELGNKKCDEHIYSLCHTLVLPLLGTLRPREGKGLYRVTQGLPPESVFWPRAPPGYRCPGAHHLRLSGRVLWCSARGMALVLGPLGAVRGGTAGACREENETACQLGRSPGEQPLA